MKKNKKASVLLYSIVLTSIALILGVVVMGNYSTLVINQQYAKIERDFYYNIKTSVDNANKYLFDLNNDGSGFVDNISCPGYVDGSTLFTMSGDTLKEDLKSSLYYYSGTILCLSDYDEKDVYIYFNDTNDGFSKVVFNGETINLSGGPDYEGIFSSDNTKITIPEDSYKYSDGFDDNFDDDDYESNTTN